jgi:hypothetical protein
MKFISNILRKIYRGILFESNAEKEYTLFNHYIIEIIPEIKKFFKNLIDVSLPFQLENLLHDHINIDFDYSDREKEIELEFDQLPNINYNYFIENKDELINMQCISFSIPDFLIIWHLFISNKMDFKSDNIFFKSLEKIYYQENYLKELITDDENEIKFFLIYNIIYNDKKRKYLENNDISYTFTDDIKNNEYILQRIKTCIKLILKGLNMINKKVYSLLVESDSNLKFLEIIGNITQIEEDLFEKHLSDNIPLSWYSLFIENNIRKIPIEYQNNNFIMLYNEILNESIEKITFLKTKSNIVNTQFGMNIRCCEKLIEKSQRDLFCMRKIEKLIWIESFIRNTNIEACLKINHKINYEEARLEKDKKK